MSARLTAADFERLRSWAIEITATLLPEGTQSRDEGPDRRFLHNGGLLIHRTKGCWYSHALGKGGWSAVALIGLLKSCSPAEATEWAVSWLASHQGAGSCNGVSDDGDDDGAAISASADDARESLANLVDVSETTADDYLRARWIEPPFPDCIKFLPDARIGESGLVCLLMSHGRIVGVQVGYLDPHGQKSTVNPKRRHFMLEKAPDAVFELPYDGENGHVLITEGLEDALSVWRWGGCRCRVLGLPGIGTLQHLKFAKGVRVTVVRDGDAPGSIADKALHTGLDHLLLTGVDVYVTTTPPLGQDANSILQAGGVDGLRTLLASAVPAVLSLRGEIEKLAQLEELDYAGVRKAEAKRLGIPVAILDAEVRKARAAATGPAAQSQQDWFDIGDTQPWADPVDGAELLDALEKLTGSFVIMTDEQRWTVALWVVFTHCFAAASNAAKLWIKSAERRSGKTRLVEILSHLTPRALRADSITAAMIPRVIEGRQPTLLLDEFDTLIKDNEALRGVINSGFDRDTVIIIGVKVGDDWEPRPFSPWCPQTLAGIGDLPDTVTDRSFKIELERKPRGTKVKRLRRRDTGPLTELAQKAARWAADNVQMLSEAEPSMPPGLNDRAADAWELCIAIADQAGGHWPQRARRAALKISGDDALADDESLGVQLLDDIRDIFETLNPAQPDKKEQQLHSADIVKALGELEHRPWAEFRRGWSITTPQLAQILRKYHITPSRMRIGEVNARGYRRTQFEKAFEQYLPPLPDPPPENPSPTPPNGGVWTGTPEQTEDPRGSQPDVRPEQEEPCSGLENPGDPCVSAVCSNVPSKTPLMEGVRDRNLEEQSTLFPSLAEKLAEKLGSVPPAPNGPAGPDGEHRPSTIEARIFEVKAQNPKRSAAWIGKQVGRPVSVVRRILANGATPPEGGAA